MNAEQLYHEAYKAECGAYLTLLDSMSDMQQAKAEMNARMTVYETYPSNATLMARLDAEWNYHDFLQQRRKETIRVLSKTG